MIELATDEQINEWDKTLYSTNPLTSLNWHIPDLLARIQSDANWIRHLDLDRIAWKQCSEANEAAFNKRFKMWREAADCSQSERDARLAAESKCARLVIAINPLIHFWPLNELDPDEYAQVPVAMLIALRAALSALSAPDAQAKLAVTETEHPLKRAARISQERK